MFGDDYPTPDGTCLRDYIHVTDLADAHVQGARGDRRDGGPSGAYNLGTGRPHSVREVIDTVERVTGRDGAVDARRRGAPAIRPCCTRRRTRRSAELGWTPQLGDLETIVRTAWDWHRAHPQGYDEK